MYGIGSAIYTTYSYILDEGWRQKDEEKLNSVNYAMCAAEQFSIISQDRPPALDSKAGI